MNGIILINKPAGLTSHDVVGKVRRILKTRRVGHTGTLDPMAEGVLPVCVGNATKASDMLTVTDKRYTAELILGMTTDTLDAEGEVLTECRSECTAEEISGAVLSFKGEIQQIPPMYSAIKKDGKKLYELAREGKSIEREPRAVTIYDIGILETDTDRQSVTIDVKCSKGTYIRTLCEDIGLKLNVGAYMNTLIRTESAGFGLDECITLYELAALADSGRAEEAIIPVDRIFDLYEAVTLSEKQSKRITNGVFVSCPGTEEDRCYRVYDENGEFLCIARCTDGRLRVVKSFWC